MCEPTSNIYSVAYIFKAMTFGKSVLLEGAHALMPDLDLGTYTATTVHVTKLYVSITFLTSRLWYNT